MKLVLIKYNAGNTQSVLYALERLGAEALVTADPDEIRSADKVIFPGVGHAKTAMESLEANGLDAVIRELTQPVLGICVGMQLLCKHSEEEDTEALDVIPVHIKRFPSFGKDSGTGELKVPQVGWNNIYNLKSPLFEGVAENSFIYNVHSYYAELSPFTIATCHYGAEYAAAVQKNNFYGVQFHAEKSAEIGDKILDNFLRLGA